MVDLNSKVYPQFTEFSGINTGTTPFNIGDGESTDEKNLGCDSFPSISQRKEDTELSGCEEFESILYIGYLFDGDLFCLGKKKEGKQYIHIYKYNPEGEEGNKWVDFVSGGRDYEDEDYIKNYVMAQIKEEDKIEAINFCGNRTVICLGKIWESKDGRAWCMYYIVSRAEKKDSIGNITSVEYYITEFGVSRVGDGSTTDIIVDGREIPGKVNYMKEKDGRLLTGSRHSANFCISEYQKLSHKNADDAAIFDIVTEAGDYCTGLALFNDTALYFKDSATYILYGKTPDSYYLDCLSRSAGCVANRSVAEANGALLWLGRDGVYAYSATTRPYKISLNVQKYIDNIDDAESACATSDGKRYYLCVRQKGGGSLMLVFDCERNLWHIWDCINYSQLIYKEGNVLGLCDNQVYMLMKEPNKGEWHFTSKPFDVGGISRNSNIYRLFMNIYAKKGSELAVYISGEAEGDNFKCIYRRSFANDKRDKVDIKIAPCSEARNLKYFRLKIAGSGECEIYGVDVYMRVKGRTY